jgi:hypothetical protein
MTLQDLIDQLEEVKRLSNAAPTMRIIIGDGDAVEWDVDHIHTERGEVVIEITLAP